MSGATYRIDVEHQPDTQSNVSWIARIVRLSDDVQVAAKWGTSIDDATMAARAWLYAQRNLQGGRTLFVDDGGNDVVPRHSVKA